MNMRDHHSRVETLNRVILTEPKTSSISKTHVKHSEIGFGRKWGDKYTFMIRFKIKLNIQNYP